jgi:hypothetical protein
VTARATAFATKDVVVAARPAPVGPVAVRTAPTAMARTTVGGDSPFAGVARLTVGFPGVSLPIKPLALPQPLEQPVSLPPAVFGQLVEVEAGALRLGAGEQVLTATGKLRTGMMLGASETNTETPVDADIVSSIASAVVSGGLDAAEVKLAAVLPASLARLPLNVDVNALVQAVLRESYLMQCELLQDFAEKVKFYNELKKRIRTELQRARQTLANASALADDAALGSEYVPAPIDAVDGYGGQPTGDGSKGTSGSSGSGGGAAPDHAASGSAAGSEQVIGSEAILPQAVLGASVSVTPKVRAGEPVDTTQATTATLPAGATLWTSQSADEVINTLRDDPKAKFAVLYADKYIVLQGSPVTAVYGDPNGKALSVSVAFDGQGSVLQLSGLPDMKAGKGSIFIDSTGVLTRTSSPPIPDGATLWSAQSADEVKNNLASGLVAAYAIPYGDDFIVLRGSPVTAVYGDPNGKPLTVSVADDGAGTVVQISGLPDMKAGKGSIFIDSTGALMRTSSPPIPDGATVWSAQSADEVKNNLASGLVAAYAIPYGDDFIVVRKNAEPPPALVASFKGKSLKTSVAASAKGAQLQFAGLPDLQQGRETLILGNDGVLAKLKADILPEGTWLWDGDPSDQVAAKLATGSVAIPYEGGYVLLSSWPPKASYPNDATLHVEVKVANGADGQLIQILGLPGMGKDDEALVIDAHGDVQAQRGPVQPDGSDLWKGEGAAQIKASLDAGASIAILYDGKYLTLTKSGDSYVATWGSDKRGKVTIAFAQREGEQVLEVFGLPGMKPTTDYLCIDAAGAGSKVTCPTTVKSAFGMTRDQVLAFLGDTANGGKIGIPFDGHFIEVTRNEDGKLSAVYQGQTVQCVAQPDGIVITGLPGLTAGERVVLDPSGTLYAFKKGLAHVESVGPRDQFERELEPDWTNASTFKAESLKLAGVLCAGMTDSQKRAIVDYFSTHPLFIKFDYYVKGHGGNTSQLSCRPPEAGESLDDYLAAMAEKTMSLGHGQLFATNMKVTFDNWPKVVEDSSDRKEELGNTVKTDPVISDDEALGRGGPKTDSYSATGPGSSEVTTDPRGAGTAVDGGKSDGDGGKDKGDGGGGKDGGKTTGDGGGGGGKDGGGNGGGDGGGTVPTFNEWHKGDPIRTKGDLDAYVKSVEEQLNTTGDDAQLANVDLQNALQVQQQTIQMMSNISKMLHDTALAIIRKIGG